MFVERKAFENSYQYQEARATEVTTYTAQLAEIDRQLSDPNISEQQRAALEAKRAAITVQLNAAKEHQR